MRTYRCTVRCQWRRQLWKIGETVECGGGEVPPSAFFEPLGPVPDEQPEPSSEPSEDDAVSRSRRGRRKKEGDDNDGPGGSEPGADSTGG